MDPIKGRLELLQKVNIGEFFTRPCISIGLSNFSAEDVFLKIEKSKAKGLTLLPDGQSLWNPVLVFHVNANQVRYLSEDYRVYLHSPTNIERVLSVPFY